MLKSSLLATSSLGLIASAFLFPQQSTGLTIGGLIGGGATFYVAEQERKYNQKLEQIRAKEQSVAHAESAAKHKEVHYQKQLEELLKQREELERLRQKLEFKETEYKKLYSQRLTLEQERDALSQEKQIWNQHKETEQESLEQLQSELKEKHRYLIEFSQELDERSSELENLRLQLVLAQGRYQIKEQELEKRRGEFEQGKQSYEETVRRAEQQKVELFIIKEVGRRVEAQSKPLLEDLERQRQDLEAAKAEFQIRVRQQESERTAFAQRSEMIAQMLEQQASDDEQAKLNAIAQVEQAKAQAMQELQETLDAMSSHYQRELMLRDRALLMARSLLAQSRQPDLIIGESLSNEELLANRAIEKGLKPHGIVAKEPYVKRTPRGFDLHFKILPLLVVPPERQVKGSEIPIRSITEGEAAQLMGKKAIPDLVASVPGASLKRPPVVDITQYGLRLIFDTSGVELEEKQPKDPYGFHEPPRNHIVKFYRLNTHVGIVGPTNIGKSTTINNTLHLMDWDLRTENNKPTHIIVADTKPSRQLEKWRPQYVGEYEALQCLVRARDEVKRRRDAWIEDYKAGRPYREFDCNYIFFIDEINLLLPFNNPIADEHKKFLQELELQLKNGVSALLLEIWRLGREFGVRLLIAGQNLKADVFNINILDLANLGWIYCGDAIEDFIRNCTVKDDKKKVETEYGLRLAQYRHTQDKKDKHFGLFKGDGALYLASMLAPDEWQEVIAEAEATYGLDEDWVQDESNPGESGSTSQVDDELLNLLKRRLEGSWSLSEEDEEQELEVGFLEWSESAEPTALVEGAKEQIVDLIGQGMTKPKEICLKIWGEGINFQSRPYNGKKGVKVLIEELVKSVGR